jgi:methyl-accepting chemotaxis protein
MTPEQIVLVQESFRKMATSADQAAEIFYNNLFELDPELRGLFPSRVAGKMMLMRSLA